MVVLDTDDPPRLAEFYTALLGWEVERTDDDWITIRGNGQTPGSRSSSRSTTGRRPGRTTRCRSSIHFDFARR